MKISTKAALISALVFPGAGHLLFKRYITAAVLSCTALVSLCLLTAYSIEKALPIADQIRRGSPPANLTQIKSILSNQLSGYQPWYLEAISFSLGIVWFIGVIDSYRYGRLLEQEKSN